MYVVVVVVCARSLDGCILIYIRLKIRETDKYECE